MRVFISWSGDRSQRLAQTLREWVPLVLHYVEPWLSGVDIAAGARWAQDVAQALEASNFGIVCITPENASSQWIQFEAGALAKSMDDSRVVPLLLNLEFSEITGPLAQFQAKKVSKSGLSEVIVSVNKAAEHPISEERARQLFDALWPKFERQIGTIPAEAANSRRVRTQHEILEELVTSQRSLDSRFQGIEQLVQDLRIFISSASPWEESVRSLMEAFAKLSSEVHELTDPRDRRPPPDYSSPYAGLQSISSLKDHQALRYQRRRAISRLKRVLETARLRPDERDLLLECWRIIGGSEARGEQEKSSGSEGAGSVPGN